MKVYRYKTIISAGLQLDSDLDVHGSEGWEAVSLLPLNRRVPGALGSEKGTPADLGNTYIYLLKREFQPHEFWERIPGEAGVCIAECGQPENHPIHQGEWNR